MTPGSDETTASRHSFEDAFAASESLPSRMGGLDEAVSVTRSITYKERKYLAPRLEAIVTSALSGLAEKKVN